MKKGTNQVVIDNPYFLSKKNWWEQDSNNLNGAIYKIGSTEIFIGNRPDLGTNISFFNSIDGWINVSDRIVCYPKNSLSQWSPWNEDGSPQYETIWSILKTLNYWISDLKLQRIYMSCDAGTHRAVSMFGFYLIAYHENYKMINDNYSFFNGRKNWSNPIEYAESYLNERGVPLLRDFLIKIKDTNSKEPGYSLETFLRSFDRKKLIKYYLQRVFIYDTKMLLYSLKIDIYHLITYSLFKGPISRIKIKIHKKLNTKMGKWYKDHGF